VQKEKYYLEFNRDEIFKNFIASEGHFRNIGISKDKAGFLNCIVKHLGDAESHLDEAISHALIVEGEESSNKFYELRDKVKDFRKWIQSSPITRDEGIKEIRKLRREFESFNEAYDISKCEACGPIDEVLKEMENILTKVKKSNKIGETKLKNDIKEDNPYSKNNNPQKTLYSIHNNKNSDNKLDNLKDVGMIYGGEQLGYGALKALLWADATYPTGFLGQKISLWGDLIGAGVGIYGGLKFDEPWDLVAALVGGYLTTDLWRHLETMLTPPAVTYTTPTGQQTGSVTYVTQNSVAVKPIPLSTGRYRVTG